MTPLRRCVPILLLLAPAGATSDEMSTMDCDAIINPEGQNLEPLHRTLDRWRAAIRAGDIDAIVGLVTADAEFWTHAQPPLHGRTALRRSFGPVLERWTLDQAFECRELIVAGDVAFVRGVEVNHLRPNAGGDAVVRRQRAFSVLRKGDDGEWRFARGMTNSPAPD